MRALPWALLALALSPPLFGQGTLTAERVPGLTPEQEEILSHMSIVYLDDGFGNPVNKTIRITGVNVQIVNGLDATNGYPPDPNSVDSGLTVVNGVGNLVVGYNELGNPLGDEPHRLAQHRGRPWEQLHQLRRVRGAARQQQPGSVRVGDGRKPECGYWPLRLRQRRVQELRLR